MKLRRRPLVLVLMVLLALAPTPAGQASPEPRSPADVLAHLSLAQRVGQLFMVGTPATRAEPAVLAAIRQRHVGSVILTGRSHAGVSSTRGVTAELQRTAAQTANDGVHLLIGTDQEGGAVQVLQGPGFGVIPSALEQGHWRPSTLRERAATWASALRKAGVSLDLAPVEDTVPSPEAARHNPPIGVFDREYGYTVRVVAHHGRAFLRGMRDRGVATAIKHFPGLGRVHANTDTTAGVTDSVTTRHDAYLRPFAASIADGAELVMMSTAIYRRLDPRRPAAFSPFVIGTMLRHDLGFRGVVVSDDLGSARQVAAWRPGARALAFVGAGGDLVLTVDPATLPAMYDAVLARARHRPHFRSLVDAAALRVLRLKQHHHLL